MSTEEDRVGLQLDRALGADEQWEEYEIAEGATCEIRILSGGERDALVMQHMAHSTRGKRAQGKIKHPSAKLFSKCVRNVVGVTDSNGKEITTGAQLYAIAPAWILDPLLERITGEESEPSDKDLEM